MSAGSLVSSAAWHKLGGVWTSGNLPSPEQPPGPSSCGAAGFMDHGARRTHPALSSQFGSCRASPCPEQPYRAQDTAPDPSDAEPCENCPTEHGGDEGRQHHRKAALWKPLQQELRLPTQRVSMERKEGEGPLCFGSSLLLFAQRDGAKGAEGGECFSSAQWVKPWKGSREPRSTPHLGLGEEHMQKWH